MKIEIDGVTYDAESGQFKKRGNLYQWNDGNGYMLVRFQKKMIRAHRLAFYFMLGRFPKLHVDHINGIRSDNRWINLREVSQGINNRLRENYGATGFKGVYSSKGRFRAAITVNKKMISLGTFKTKEEAAKAYDDAAKKYFGEFCKLNFAV